MRRPSTPKIVVLIALSALFAALVAGCGGGSGADSDPQELLDATFGGGGETVDSGVLDLTVEAQATGDGGGSLSGSLQGPFQTRGEDQPPLVGFDVALNVDGAGQKTDVAGGLTITEDAAFVTVDGQAYEVDAATYATFTELFAQSAAAQQDQGDEGSAVFDQLGIDPSNWLTDVSNEGVEEVGGAETVHITGTADVAQIVADAEAVDPTGNALGAAGSGELADAVQAATVDVYTGVDDNILRRLDLTLEIADPGSSGETLSLSLSVGISAVNEEQSFDSPADAKPLDELIPGGVGAIAGGLGALGADAGGTGGGGGGSDLGALPPEYQQCIGNAQSSDDFAACNDLLQ